MVAWSTFTTAGFYPQSNNVGNSDGHYHAPFFLMVDRGECRSITKVRNAQRAGAAAVLIADNLCVCSHDICTAGNQKGCQYAEPFLTDDGSGGDITIPSFILYKEDADAIKQVLMKNQQVVLSIGFSIPATDARVEYELWTSPTDVFLDERFWSSVRAAALALGEHAAFTPHMSFHDGAQQGCTQAGNPCRTMCTNHGRYCAFDPDNDYDSGVSGAEIVTENLRRICIWKTYGQKDGIGKEWWDYVQAFDSHCYKDGNLKLFADQTCIVQVMRKAKVSTDTVDACIRDSGGLELNAPNSLLDAALQKMSESGTVRIPSVLVNRVPVRGALRFTETFLAICAGFMDGSQPIICQECQGCPHTVAECVQNGGSCRAARGGLRISYPLFAGMMGGIIIFFLGMGHVYHRREQRHVRESVRVIMVGILIGDSFSLTRWISRLEFAVTSPFRRSTRSFPIERKLHLTLRLLMSGR